MRIINAGLHVSATLDNKVVLRTLSRTELEREYAELRFAVLHHELGWASSKLLGAGGLIDTYDSHSLPCGVFHGRDLVGAFRVVVGESVDSLPSGSAIERLGITSGNYAELSRGMVKKEYCRCGVFTALIAARVHLARTAKMGRVFATIVDSRLGRELFQKENFVPIGHPFNHSDGVITVFKPTILLSAEFDCKAFNESESLARLTSALNNVRDIESMVAQRLLQTSGGKVWLGDVKKRIDEIIQAAGL